VVRPELLLPGYSFMPAAKRPCSGPILNLCHAGGASSQRVCLVPCVLPPLREYPLLATVLHVAQTGGEGGFLLGLPLDMFFPAVHSLCLRVSELRS